MPEAIIAIDAGGGPVTIAVERTPVHVDIVVEVDGRRLRYQLTVQDEGVILETIAGADDNEDMDTLVQSLYSEHPDTEV